MKKDMFLIVNNLLTPGECEKLIKLYKDHQHLNVKWPPGATGPCAHAIDSTKVLHPLLSLVLKRMEKTVQKYFNSKITIDWSELKQHDKEASHNLHYDGTSNKTILSSITYLNTLTSGHTYFMDGTQVCPKAGRMIIFNGCKYRHGAKVTTKERHTIPVWYK